MADEFMTIKNCNEKHREIMSALSELNNRLYRDNGHLSIQTRLDRGDRILGILCWVTTTAAGAIIVGMVALVFRVLTHKT